MLNPIPEELINAIPDFVEADRGACEHAADSALNVLLLMAEQFKRYLTIPPILSNGVEVWPMPSPYYMPMDSQPVVSQRLNEYLRHTKVNATAFNECVSRGDVPGARSLAEITPKDCNTIWNDSSALACRVEEGSVYQNLALSEATKHAFMLANDPFGLIPPETEAPPPDAPLTESYQETYSYPEGGVTKDLRERPLPPES